MDAPRLTPSMRIALEEVKLEQIAVIYPGTRRYPLAKRVNAVPLNQLAAGGVESVFRDYRSQAATFNATADFWLNAQKALELYQRFPENKAPA